MVRERGASGGRRVKWRGDRMLWLGSVVGGDQEDSMVDVVRERQASPWIHCK